MHENNAALVAIDAVLRTTQWCTCGKVLDLVAHGNGLWLECSAFAGPSRLPAPLAHVVRDLLHERSFVLELPEAEVVVPAAAPAARVARVPKTAAAHA